MCNLKNLGIVGTYLQWIICVAIISLYNFLILRYGNERISCSGVMS
jgi:hypothetical protein